MKILAVGAAYCALAVLAGAFGAHGLRTRLDAAALGQWETAARYLMYGGLGLCLLGLTTFVREISATPAVAALAFGTAVFAGTVFGLALGGPRWLGAVTPIGGAAMVFGFLAFAWLAWRL
jgi:uncharacterized membrane protein YgdD (TMEM256/DUF423 family)